MQLGSARRIFSTLVFVKEQEEVRMEEIYISKKSRIMMERMVKLERVYIYIGLPPLLGLGRSVRRMILLLMVVQTSVYLSHPSGIACEQCGALIARNF